MRKQLFALVLIVILGSSYAYSQQKPVVFGFKAGATMGWMNPDTKGYSSTGIKPGFTWGFIADFFLMENYGIATGFDVVFLNAGLEMPHRVIIDSVAYDGNLDRKYMLKYIQIPVTLKMRTNEMGKFRIFGQIGLGTNFLINAKADDTFTSGEQSVHTEGNDIYNDISFMRESLILGAGVDFSLGGSTSLFAAFVFNNGFIDVLKGKNTIDPTLNNKANANYLSFEVGIVF
jgi:hypothetical protein